MEYNQIMMADVLETNEMAFKKLHLDIATNATLAAEHLVNMANGLKEMRDTKAYECAGFKSFEEYTESTLNIKNRQALYYISVVEKLPSEFAQSNAHLGITKLSIFATMSERDRDDMVAVVGVDAIDKMNVVEVQELKTKYEDRIKQLQMELSEQKNSEPDDELSEELAKERAELAKARAEKKRLEEQLKIERDNVEQGKRAIIKQASDYKQDLQDAKANVKTVEKIVKEQDPALKAELDKKELEAQALAAKVAQSNERIAELEKQIKLSDSSVVKFKTLCNIASNAFENVLEHVHGVKDNEEQKAKFIAIVSKLCDKIKSELK